MISVAVVILTYNEEIHLARALQCVSSFACEVFVVDSFSTDRTVEIAREHGATVLQNKFVNYAKQFQWGLDNAPISADWVMRLDADEVVEPDLAGALIKELPKLGGDIVGINLNRKHIFLGRWIRHGGRYPLRLLRIWRRGHGRIEDRWMDEHMIVWGGRAITIDGGFADHNLNDLTFFTHKHNKYASREAVDILNQRLHFLPGDEPITMDNTSWQASSKRFIKQRFYNRISFQYSALLYFLYRYFLQLGFLDGIEGLTYHVLQGLWYRFLVGAKVFELQQAIAGLVDPVEIKSEVARLTKLEIEQAVTVGRTATELKDPGSIRC
jgi:glycosyltransferase involved in cell wall biosynthesis